LKSKGKWITAIIELPYGYDLNDIDIQTIKLKDTVPAEPKPTSVGDHNGNGIPDMMVKFDRCAVRELLAYKCGRVEMIVAGKAGTQCFRGKDIIIVKNK